jgi:hypothetical protein
MSNNATTSQTVTKPYDQFRDLSEGLFSVSKKELNAKLSEEKSERQAERERKRQARKEKQE